MYVVYLLFYAIGRFNLFLYLSFSFSGVLGRTARRGTIPYFVISWFSCSCSSALFGKYNW